jgi:uncharacterized protein with ATP-grasp and redox domains
MKTYLDCIPCFYRQAIAAARLANLAEGAQRQIVIELSKNVEKFLSGYSPPEIARMVYDIINKYANTEDIYKELKENNNEFALKLYPKLQQKIAKADHSLLLATELAIAGNIIDYGAKNSLDVDCEIDKIVNASSELFWASNKIIADFASFKNKILHSKFILYLGDNAGEIVFDKLLVETIKQHNPAVEIYYAVKEKPIINDALMQDAIQCGIDKFATVISSGSGLSGTILEYCTPDFLTKFNEVDLVISKGQGNFEGLHQASRDIHFLFIVKCPVIAGMINGNIGNMVLFYKK